MNTDVDQRWAELKARLAKLRPEDQARALDGFTQVLTLVELPREPGESVSLTIGLERSGNVAYPSG